MDITPAVVAPRFHHQHLPDTILLEDGGFSAERVAALKSMGHATKGIRHIAISPSILRTNGVWRGSADPRTGGAAVGF
jgi:gamma-glutamyltranspeptidase/glutathione hydrolase